MENLEKNKRVEVQSRYTIKTSIGFQADITGYGKTASMVGLLARDRMQWMQTSDNFTKRDVYSNDGLVEITRLTNLRKINSSLVVASQSIVSQWVEELKKSELTYAILKTRRQIANLDVEKVDVVVSTPTMYNCLMRHMSGVAWKRFVYDEPGTCHIPAMVENTAGFTWFVTATPDQIRWRYAGRNTNHCIASMLLGQMDVVFFDALLIRNDPEYVESSWTMPETHYTTYPCSQPVSRTMRGLVPEQVSIMLEAENIRGAISYLGGSETDNIVDVVRERFEEEIREAEHKIQRYERRRDLLSTQQWKEKLVRCKERLRTLDVRFSEALNGQCGICLEKLSGPVLVPCCQNLLCGQCMLTWMNAHTTCPLCRTETMCESLVYVCTEDDRVTSSSNQLPHLYPTKPVQILRILKSRPNSKTIIFSNEDATYPVIKKKLSDERIVCNEIRGTVSTRDKLISDFKKGSSSVLFLNAQNNGAGINLQECTDIILYHKMGESARTQIMGRANRIGRYEELHVHQLEVQCSQV